MESVLFNIKGMSYPARINAMAAHCNLTSSMSPAVISSSIAFIETKHPEVKCYVVSKTKNTVYQYFHFYGDLKLEVAQTMIQLNEAGVLTMVQQIGIHVGKLKFRNLKKIERNAPFKISDWKMLSIFLGWIALLGFALFSFVYENRVVIFSLKHILIRKLFKARITLRRIQFSILDALNNAYWNFCILMHHSNARLRYIARLCYID